MSIENSELAAAAEAFHEEVPYEFQVSLSMSLDTRNKLDAVQDELNEAAGERVFSTNDAMQAALVAAARYHEFANERKSNLDDVDEEQLIPITSAIRDVVQDEEENTVE